MTKEGRIRQSIVVGSIVSATVLWGTTLPLGVPGEWFWDRTEVEPDTIWNLVGGTVAAALLISFIMLGRQSLAKVDETKQKSLVPAAWLGGLVLLGFVWLWIEQEVSPIQNRLGKAAFVLFYPNSSGYFTRSRYDEPRPGTMLAKYEELMGEGDVLHTGTHPPGLFLAFHGLISICSQSPSLASFLDVTQPPSFREACDVIAGNSLRAHPPRIVDSLDRRVLWLATLLVMVGSSLTVVPLYLLLRRSASRAISWSFSAMWPAVPAIAVFIPKSDAIFPLIAVSIMAIWLSAWDRRSVWMGFTTGLLIWCGLICSLAFLPILLLAGLLTAGAMLFPTVASRDSSSIAIGAASQKPVGGNDWICVIGLVLGFVLPTYLFWQFAHVNLLNVWLLNYRNHAGFYQQFTRTYWNWLLVNPVELCFSIGWPVMCLAIIASTKSIQYLRTQGIQSLRSEPIRAVFAILFVWGLLWVSGKNSGEAARLWILLLPWMIWLASTQFPSSTARVVEDDHDRQNTLFILIVQYLLCLLTAVRVNGFHIDG